MKVTIDARINLIRENLNDRYKQGFPIIKELVQNADDSTATELHLGWIASLPEAQHSLLKGPAIFVLNNGTFKNEDIDALDSIGLSSKAGSKLAVGKFGLGLKSIFHLCEAFFYLASSSEVASPVAHIVNPWADDYGHDRFHKDWDVFAEADQAIIKSHFKALMDTEQYFYLWIPLRREGQLGKHHPIRPHYPGDQTKPDTFFPNHLPTQLATLIPLLRSLKKITGWTDENSSLITSKPSFTVALTGSTRRRYPVIDGPDRGQKLPLNGSNTVTITSPDNQHTHYYSGIEIWKTDDVFSRLQSLKVWPVSGRTDPETGEYKNHKDKADPHCAVCFIKYPASQNDGRLTITTSVFLPVDKPEFDSQKSTGASHFLLILHGYFFLDAGRSSIDGLPPAAPYPDEPENQDLLRTQWNGLIMQQGIMPLILPALSQFVQESKLSHIETELLTQALRCSTLLENKAYRHQICAQHHWVCCVSKTGESWQLLSRAEPIFELLAAPKSDPSRPFDVFPALADIEHLTQANLPRLTREAQPSQWGPKLATLLGSVNAEQVFSQQGLLTYLVEFLETNANQFTDAAVVALKKLTWRAFQNLALADLRKNKGLVARLLKLLPGESRIALKFARDDSLRKSASFEPVMSALVRLELEILLIPDDLAPDDAESTAVFSPTDALRLLKQLAEPDQAWIMDPNFDSLRQELALRIIGSVQSQKRNRVLSHCEQEDLKVFKAYDCVLASDVPVGLAELKRAQQENALFKNAVPPSPHLLLAPRLQDALKECRVLVVSSSLANLRSDQIETCTANACLKTLARQPRLNNPEDRAKLLQALLKDFDNFTVPERFLGLRYLLHGQTHHYSDKDDLWLITQADFKEKIWQRIASHLLAENGAMWRLISSNNLTNSLNPHQLSELRIKPINQTTLDEWLGRHTGPLTLEFPERTEQEQLLRRLSVQALKKLKIHETIDGNLTLIEEGRTYLEGDFDIGQALRQRVILLRRHRDPEISAKQGKLVGPLTAHRAIEIALKEDQPHQYWDVIMNALESIGSPDSGLVQRLQKIGWLPNSSSSGLKPNQVIYIPNLDQEIENFVASSDRGMVGILSLGPSLVEHPAFSPIARHIFMSQAEATKELGQIMAEKEDYRVGKLDLSQFSTTDLSSFINIFFDEPELMPIAGWIKAVEPYLDLQSCLTHLLPPLTKEISPERMVAVLNFLAADYQNSRSQTVLQFHLRYLTIAAKMPTFTDQILPAITLLNQNREWIPTSQLCFEVPGIDTSNLLDSQQGKVIKPGSSISGNDSASTSSNRQTKNYINRDTWRADVKASIDRLHNYFRDWEPVVECEVIGTFLSFLGGDAELVKLTQHYLGNRNVDQVRSLFKWVARQQIDESLPKIGGYGQNAQEAIRMHRYIVDIVEISEETRQVTAITGQIFEAKLSKESKLFNDPESTLFVGDFRYIRDKEKGYQVNRIGLRRLTISPQYRDKLPELLKHSIKKILKDFYWQEIPNFDEAWADIEHSEQLDIETAQEILIESAFFYLPQYGLRTNAHISPLLRRWREAHNRLIGDKRVRRVGGTPSEKSTAEKDQVIVQEELKEYIEDRPEVRQAILAAVREKIGSQFQYQRASVLFELFQNADDAASELEQLYQGEQSLSDRNRRIELIFANTQIIFKHWGRSINQVYAGSANGRNLGYGDDLTKMLTMQDSDKSVHAGSETSVTGKFGLGFKSVFLISDSPNIVSGRLGFKIIGGIYPLDLPLEDITRLKNMLGADSGKSGTVFELPFDNSLSPAINLDEITNDFKELIHIVLMFAKAIKHCEITDEKQRRHKTSWEQIKCLTLPGIFLDAWRPATQSFKTESAVLVFKSDQGSLLLQLGPEGVQPLPATVPTIWVTVPTQEKHGVGFALNGLFDLDVGRAQLARNSMHNRLLAEHIGEALGKQLCDLFYTLESDENWSQFQAQVKESSGVELASDQYLFWFSLWQQLGDPLYKKEQNEAVELVRAAFGFAVHQPVGDNRTPRGIVRLISECHALPTGLWQGFRVLTRLDQIKYVTKNTLDTEEVFCQVIEWDSFKADTGRLKPGEAISERVERVLKKLVPLFPKCEALSLKQVIGWEVDRDYSVSLETAERLGKLITPEFMLRLSKEKPTEFEELQDSSSPLRKAHFECRDGKFYPAGEILIPYSNPTSDEQDEALRAKFAPDSNVLASKYNKYDSALDFFKVCRPKMQARVKEELAEWALTATRPKQVAVLKYLLHGSQAKSLANYLTDGSQIQVRFDDSWLSRLAPHLYPLNQFTLDEQSELLGRLKLVSKPDPTSKPIIRESAEKVLNEIYDWWQQEQTTCIKRYESDVYPHGQPPILRRCFDPDFIDDRRNWLTLLLLGSFYTMGRTLPQQHRNFLQLCQDESRDPVWFEVFSAPEQEPRQWIEVLRQYIDTPTDEAIFYQWMKQFVSIFHLSHWMNAYVESFLAIDRIKRNFRLEEITNLRTSPVFQRGGVEAPPITRSLGIGGNFVVREMVRLSVIKSEYAYEHCYVPTEKIRNFFETLGCQQTSDYSPQIHNFLRKHLGPQKATFDLAFDIPFHYWLQDKGC